VPNESAVEVGTFLIPLLPVAGGGLIWRGGDGAAGGSGDGALQHAITQVVGHVVDSAAPLEQLRAEAMVAVAACMRREAAKLPAGDELAVEFKESARDYSMAARIVWPPVGQVRPVGPPRSA
jgi:hypothetical protein